MASEQPPFVYDTLNAYLRERLEAGIRYIESLPNDDVVRSDTGSIIEVIRQFSIKTPGVSADALEADDRILESFDLIRDRKTGDTNHSFFIPIDGDIQWLADVDSQRTAIDKYPLAFLDKKRNRIKIRLTLCPSDHEGSLKERLEYRVGLVLAFGAAVDEKIVEFNAHLATEMSNALNARKQALQKAEKELELIGARLIHNPEHEEKAIQIERVLGSLEAYLTVDTNSKLTEIRPFIVHGHDHASLYELKDYLQNTLKFAEPVILRHSPGLGRTLIEKFEQEAKVVKLVFVLLTPDDQVAGYQDDNDTKRRARQNVILELGFFLGKLGRESGRVLLLCKPPIEIPSDIVGIEYIDISNGINSAGETIRRELRALNILSESVS